MSRSNVSNKYQKIMDWLLNSVNPEMAKILSTMSHMIQNTTISTEIQSNNQRPTNLVEVLGEVQKAELYMLEILQFYLPSEKLQSSNHSPITIGSEEPFEKIFTKVLPRIDESLNVTESAIFAINNSICKLTLKPIPPVDPNETATKRQVRFIDKAKRIRANIETIDEYLSTVYQQRTTEEPQTPPVTLLYSPPPWSTPPVCKFYFEVRNNDVVVNKVPMYTKGHYLIGRLPVCDIVLEDVTCSRQHCVIQFRPGDPDPNTGERTDEAYIFDLGSTSGSYVNAMALQPNAYYPLFPCDIIQFGQYPCSFILRNGTEPNLIAPDVHGQQPSTQILSDVGAPVRSDNFGQSEPQFHQSHNEEAQIPLATARVSAPIKEKPPTNGVSSTNEIPSVQNKVSDTSAVPAAAVASSTSNPVVPNKEPNPDFQRRPSIGRRPAPVRTRDKSNTISFMSQDDEYEDELGKVRPRTNTTVPSKSPENPAVAAVSAQPRRESNTPGLDNVNNILALDSQLTPNSSPMVARKTPQSNPIEVKKEPAISETDAESSGSSPAAAPAAATTSVNPRSAAFNEAEYKQKMLEAYERQQAENAEILRKRKEREALGLPPIVEIPYVPERPRRNTITSVPEQRPKKKKKRLWWKKG